jgi:hypothetical protein
MADKHLIEARPSASADRKTKKLREGAAVLLKFGDSVIQDKHWKCVEKISACITSKKAGTK